MIELTQIEIEVGYGDDLEIIEITKGEVIELITRLREAEKYAARYRWLRDVASDYQRELAGKIPSKVMDMKIDQAMKENGDE